MTKMKSSNISKAFHKMETHQFKVPATSANMGPGFDSIGVALEKFLDIEASESDRWHIEFEDAHLEVLPQDETNLVIQTAVRAAGKYDMEMPPLEIHMGSEIPLTHGMGSSASAIVAGIELADRFCGLNLSDYDKVLRASEVEGHPDNVGPAVCGGLFVGFYKDGALYYQTADLNGLTAVMSVPEYEIDTKEARAVLPGSYSKQDTVEQNAVNNVMLMALMRGDFKSMGELMMKDLIHEPYRSHLIKEYDDIRSISLKNGAYATVISGAGPSLLTVCDKKDADRIVSALSGVPDCLHESIDIFTKH